MKNPRQGPFTPRRSNLDVDRRLLNRRSGVRGNGFDIGAIDKDLAHTRSDIIISRALVARSHVGVHPLAGFRSAAALHIVSADPDPTEDSRLARVELEVRQLELVLD